MGGGVVAGKVTWLVLCRFEGCVALSPVQP